jgi:hypothetical protein
MLRSCCGESRRSLLRIVRPSVGCAVMVFLGSLMTIAEEPMSKHAKNEDLSGVTDVVSLDESDLKESSGLAISHREPLHFWSHNDSGGEARLYAFDSTGHKTGHLNLKSTKFEDWEDLSAFVQDGVPRLLIADCGDNDFERSHARIHLFDEPDPTKKTTLDDDDIQTLRVTYEDGPQDCEAVAVDVSRGLIILVSKTKLPYCGVYAIPLPPRTNKQGDMQVTAKRVCSLPIPMVTALDVDANNGDLWLVSYFHALCYRCTSRLMPLHAQFSGSPEIYELPRWKQIEAVAIDGDHNVWLTSEGKKAPLGRLTLEALAAQRARLLKSVKETKRQ